VAKQVIVVRKDLKMRKGKIAAQAAHASMKVFFDRNTGEDRFEMRIPLDPYMVGWVEGDFTKVVVYVESEEELLACYVKANELKLPTALITDSGKTEFNGVATNTCVAIGPAADGKIDQVTGELKLL